MSAFLKNVSRCTRYLRNAPSLLPWISLHECEIGQRRIGRASAISKTAVALGSTLAVTCWFIAPVHGQSESDEQYESYEEEMGMEDADSYGYGGSSSSSYGGPGSGPNASGRGVSTQQLVTSRLSDALASALKSTSLESLTNPEAAPPVLSGPVLLNDATVAYAKGNYALAMRLYFGHIVAEYDSAQSQLQLVKYSPLMKRPAWQLRWGVSYAVRGDATDPQPIGDIGAVSRGVGGFQDGSDMGMEDYGDDGGYDEVGSGGPRGGPPRGGPRGAMRGQGSQGPSRGPVGSGPPQGAMDMDMQDYAYEEDMQDMYDGTMDMDMDMGGYGGPRRQADAPVRPPTAAERLATLPLSMLSEESDQALQDNLGVVATILGEEFEKRYAQGDFGRAMTDVTPESGSADAVSEAFVNLMETTENSLPLWRPGIVFLGEGLSADNTRRAQKADLDLIIHFDILLKPLRGSEYTQNISRCRLIHVPSGKSLGVSKTIDSLEFATKSRAKSLASRDYVNEQMANFFEIMDRQTVTTELPSLTKEIVLKRIGTLLGSGGGANLRTLAEVRLFQSQHLLDEEDVLAAFDIVGGEEALQLIFASEEERVRIVRKWAGGNVSETE